MILREQRKNKAILSIRLLQSTAGILIAASLFMLLFTDCKQKSGRPHPDVSAVTELPDYLRLEQALFQNDKVAYEKSISHLRQSDAELLDFYMYDLMQLPYDVPKKTSDSLFYSEFIQSEQMRALLDTVLDVYGNFEPQQKQLDEAYRYFKHYFPEQDIPTLFTYVAPFTYQSVIAEDMIGIELDMFLGRNFSIYNRLPQIPKYLLPRLTPEYLPMSVMLVQAGDLIYRNFEENNLLNHIIYEGKMLYFLDRIFPDAQDSSKIGYTTWQIEWCEQEEPNIWEYLVSEDLLFSKSTDDIAAIVGDGPSTKGMPPESPGRVGAWVGWQIVRAYMDKNREVTLAQLFANKDALQILENSRYRP